MSPEGKDIAAIGLGVSGFLFLMYMITKNKKAKISSPEIKYVKRLPNPRRAMTIPPFGIFIKEEYRNTKIL